MLPVLVFGAFSFWFCSEFNSIQISLLVGYEGLRVPEALSAISPLLILIYIFLLFFHFHPTCWCQPFPLTCSFSIHIHQQIRTEGHLPSPLQFSCSVHISVYCAPRIIYKGHTSVLRRQSQFMALSIGLRVVNLPQFPSQDILNHVSSDSDWWWLVFALSSLANFPCWEGIKSVTSKSCFTA